VLQKRVTRRRFLSAVATLVAGATLGLETWQGSLPISPSPLRFDPQSVHGFDPQSVHAEGLRHLAWVWQFNADGQPDVLVSVLAQNSLGVLLKTHDGTDWMSRWDDSMHAVTGPEQVAKLAGYFESSGVPFHTWYVAEGLNPEREAEMCAQVIAAGARSVTVDLEPFDGFWQGTPDSALAFGREFRKRQPDGILYVTVDPRPWIIKDTPVAEFASFSQGFAPMAYWDSFNSPDNVGLFREYGFPPDEAGVTPEFVLDVTHQTLSPYGLPIWPAGDGASRSDDAWSRFVSHAYDLGMGSVSVWRYGVTDERIWRLLKEMQPGFAEAPGLRPGQGARIVNTGICLKVYAKPSRSADIIAYVADGTRVTLIDGSTHAEGYRWWLVQAGETQGWMPEGDTDGVPWLLPLPTTGVNAIRLPS